MFKQTLFLGHSCNIRSVSVYHHCDPATDVRHVCGVS